jgi:hypothetical protein
LWQERFIRTIRLKSEAALSIPFSRSLRSLNKDNFNGTRWIVGLGFFILILWGLWFLLAPNTLYEVSEAASAQAQAGLTSSGVATFPITLGSKIQPGQPARFQPKNPADLGSRYANIAAAIKEVKKTSRALEVTFILQLPADAYANLPQDMQGSLEVEVGHTTPINLIFGSTTAGQASLASSATTLTPGQEVLV